MTKQGTETKHGGQRGSEKYALLLMEIHDIFPHNIVQQPPHCHNETFISSLLLIIINVIYVARMLSDCFAHNEHSHGGFNIQAVFHYASLQGLRTQVELLF